MGSRGPEWPRGSCAHQPRRRGGPRIGGFASAGGVGGRGSVAGAVGRTVAGTSIVTIAAAIANGVGGAGAWARAAAAINGSAKHHPGPAWCFGVRRLPSAVDCGVEREVRGAADGQEPHVVPVEAPRGRIGQVAIAPQSDVAVFAAVAGAGGRHVPPTGIAAHVA